MPSAVKMVFRLSSSRASCSSWETFPGMNELSCKVVIGLVEMSERKGIARATLLSGHRHSPEHIMNGRNRTDWAIGMEILRRMREEAGSREAFLAIADSWGQVPGHSYIRPFAAALFSPLHLYTYPEKVMCRMNISCLNWDWEKISPRELIGTFTTAEGYEANGEFWDIHIPVKRKLPILLGLPDAEVELIEASAHKGVFRIVLPPSGTIWARARRFLRMGRNEGVLTADGADKTDGGKNLSAISAPSAVEMASRQATSQGNELSCRILVGVVEMAEAAGIPREKLLTGFRHSPEHLMDGRNRTDWDIGMEIVRRFRSEAGSREAFLQAASSFGQTPSYRYIRLFAAGIFDPFHLYTYPNRAISKMNAGPFIDWHWKRIGPREIEGIHTTGPAHPALEDLWDLHIAVYARLPSLLGLPDAVVELRDWSPHHGRYRILLPPSKTLWAQAGRFFRMHGTSPDPAFAIFAQQHEDLRRSYEMLNATERERADLARDLLRVADKEREHFAREIHDGLGQELVAIKYQLEYLAQQADGQAGAQAAKLAEVMNKTHQLARSLARSYDPLTGADGDFADAIRKLAAQYDGKAAFVFEGLDGVALEPDKATHLYRIAQEAVNNALRHGRASRISISLRRSHGEAEFAIADNGSGTIPEQPQGMGLRTMKYRAGELGGTLEVGAAETGGMRVTCVFPDSEAGAERKLEGGRPLPP